MNLAIVQPKVQAYLEKHSTTPLHTFILKGSPFKDITIQELAQQLDGLRRTKKKLPLWHRTKGILFPPKLNLEQTSSEVTAHYKASIMEGSTLLDGTGGFGIDAYYFAQKKDEVTHIEKNEKLSALAKRNAALLGQSNIQFIQGDTIEYLSSQNTFYDCIYLDPGRRLDSIGKVFMLKDCLPNVPLYKQLLLSHCTYLWIKTAPLLDITAGIKELETVEEIHIVAVNNEVKELLWKVGNVQKSDVKVAVVNLESKQPAITFTLDTAQNAEAHYANPKKYLYEPNAALLKSGAFNWVSQYFKIDKLGEHSHLYTSDELITFPGRTFEINKVLPYKKNISKELDFEKANITTRNFPITVDRLRKKLKIKDGGDVYAFFTTLENGNLVVLICKKK